ncbi:hypothetical protein [Rubellicoccus peritrichatus]|uniref:Uncharacterized protein n=1 Tax=Rubellicoccus peritrichatus TaxID=3080537 RepID=A0AAQ3L5W2_9BACT|nr:hypothetical protein [Puniceicoccus sp. CR14]WOO39456.1 hypothetical protein RZN69_12600 [Puniceicoccus sp. CR14]
MKLKTLLLLAILGAAGYYAYGFAVTQYNQPALAYKRYAAALMEGDRARAKSQAVDDEALVPFQYHAQRMSRLDGEQRFVWYTFIDQRFSEDGNSVTMVVRQTVRVDPPGSDSFFGTEIRKDRHTVTLIKDQSAWKIKRFDDSATQLGHSEKVAGRQG